MSALAVVLPLLLSLPTTPPGACSPDRPLQPCELQIYQDALTWEGRARESRAQLEGCTEKLATRTSTVIERLVPRETPPPPTSGTSVSMVVVIAATSALAGIVLGVALGGGPGVVVAR